MTADGRLVLATEQVQAQGITSEAVTMAASVPLPGLPASASAPLDASARIVVPYAGVVTGILVDEGGDVAKGQALLRIQSRDFLAAQADLARARGEATAASLQSRRDSELLREGIVSASIHEQSRARALAAAGALQQAAGALSRLRPVAGGMPGEYEILSPLAGRVLRRSVEPGQALDALDEIFTVARPGSLDINFSAPVGARAALRPGIGIDIPEGKTATVVAVGADTDAASQTLRVRARAADGTSLVAGQQFTVTLRMPAPAGSLAVPASALLPEGNGHVLYGIDGTTVRRIPVQALLGTDKGSSVVLASGLKPGDRVVAQGTATLKALMPAGRSTEAGAVPPVAEAK